MLGAKGSSSSSKLQSSTLFHIRVSSSVLPLGLAAQGLDPWRLDYLGVDYQPHLVIRIRWVVLLTNLSSVRWDIPIVAYNKRISPGLSITQMLMAMDMLFVNSDDLASRDVGWNKDFV